MLMLQNASSPLLHKLRQNTYTVLNSVKYELALETLFQREFWATQIFGQSRMHSMANILIIEQQ